MCLLLQGCNGTLKCINGLTVISVGGIMVRLLNFADLGGCLNVTISHGDVLLMFCNLLGGLGCNRRVRLNVCLEHVYLLVGLFNCTLLLNGCVVTGLLVGGKLHLLPMCLQLNR